MIVDTSIFKAYDIRGIYPTQINLEIAYAIGQAYAKIFDPSGEVTVGNDVRLHSVELKDKIIAGLIDAGINVCDIGLISTDMLYFAVGNYKSDGGIQITASHNPAEWHGAKFVKKGPEPVTRETGIDEIRKFVESGEKISKSKGSLRKMDILDDYCKFLLNWIDYTKLSNFKIVFNPNFGFAGEVVKQMIKLGNLPIEPIWLNEIPNGAFPKGRPDPFLTENRSEFVDLVKSSGADLGVAWDGDADRVFFCSNAGELIEPYFLNTILIEQMLIKHPGEKIIYDVRYTWALKNAIAINGGVPLIERVGHSYIKERMLKEDALFATESSGHTYYREYWHSDCGMLPALQVLEYLSKKKIMLSDAISSVMKKYFISGEINSTVSNPVEIIEKIRQKYHDAKIETLDGISIEYPDWRFNVRTSNTEPLLRLCLEAKSKELMEIKRDEVLLLIRK